MRAPKRTPELGADWALVVFCTFAAPPALVLAGLLHAGSSPGLFWLAACVLFFTGLSLSLRLPPLPPRRVFASGVAIQPASELFAEIEGVELELPGVGHDASRAEVLEQLAKLRERGDLSGAEYLRARERLVGD